MINNIIIAMDIVLIKSVNVIYSIHTTANISQSRKNKKTKKKNRREQKLVAHKKAKVVRRSFHLVCRSYDATFVVNAVGFFLHGCVLLYFLFN